jgi:hypothetical protein
MRNCKTIVVYVLLTLALAIGFYLYPGSRAQVVGKLSPEELADVQHLVQLELRSSILPKLEWDNLFHLGYVIRSVREYEAQRILWAEVHSDRSVAVFAGVSKDEIHSEGHAFTLRKNPNWEITGYAYWSSSNVAPADIRVPQLP